VIDLYDRIVNPDLLVRRVTIVANRLTQEAEVADAQAYEQMSLFTDYDALQKEREEEKAAMAKERRLQEAMLAVKKRYGKNAILKGMNLQEGATSMERNNQIGGHRA
jgi:DNA polymerase V